MGESSTILWAGKKISPPKQWNMLAYRYNRVHPVQTHYAHKHYPSIKYTNTTHPGRAARHSERDAITT